MTIERFIELTSIMLERGGPNRWQPALFSAILFMVSGKELDASPAYPEHCGRWYGEAVKGGIVFG